MGNYQCHKCGIPKNHGYMDKRHLLRKHCREHNKDSKCNFCPDCEGSKSNHGCYHKFKFVWWCIK